MWGWIWKRQLYPADSLVYSPQLFIWAAKLFHPLGPAWTFLHFLFVFSALLLWPKPSFMTASPFCPYPFLSVVSLSFFTLFHLPCLKFPIELLFTSFQCQMYPFSLPLNLVFTQTSLHFISFDDNLSSSPPPPLSPPDSVSFHFLGLFPVPQLTHSWFTTISIPSGWKDSTMCRVSPLQEPNNGKWNICRNLTLPSHGREIRRNRLSKKKNKGNNWMRQKKELWIEKATTEILPFIWMNGTDWHKHLDRMWEVTYCSFSIHKTPRCAAEPTASLCSHTNLLMY